MKAWKVLTLCVACMAAFSLSIPSDVEAKRLGGGRSFGSSPSMSRPATPSAPSGTYRQQSNTYSRQANPAAGAGAAAMNRPGWGGMLGGLLAGTFIGSMLFGNGMAGAGAGGGLLDLIILVCWCISASRCSVVLRQTSRVGQPRPPCIVKLPGPLPTLLPGAV